jgi:integrase
MKNELWIKEFLTYLDARADISAKRKKKYKSQLNAIREWCPCEFDKARREDLEVVVASVLKGKVRYSYPAKGGVGRVVRFGGEFKDSTKSNYLETIRIFWRWLRNREAGTELYDDGEYPPEVKWIKQKGLRITSAVKSKDEFLTDEEFEQLIRLATPKYRALWSLLREKGARINEVLSCKVGDLQLIDENTATLKIASNIRGKTIYSKRTIGITDSLPFLVKWLDENPSGRDPEAWLFPNNGHHKKHARLNSEAAIRTLQRAARDAGITKRVWHHLFRHEAITRARGELNLGDGPVKAEFGLSPSSKVLANYSHLTSDDANRAYFEAKGVWKRGRKKEDRTKPKPCPWCSHHNVFTNVYCDKCARPLDPTQINEFALKGKVAGIAVAWMQQKQPDLFEEFSKAYKEYQARGGA